MNVTVVCQRLAPSAKNGEAADPRYDPARILAASAVMPSMAVLNSIA
jgi:hypothetical protein